MNKDEAAIYLSTGENESIIVCIVSHKEIKRTMKTIYEHHPKSFKLYGVCLSTPELSVGDRIKDEDMCPLPNKIKSTLKDMCKLI